MLLAQQQAALAGMGPGENLRMAGDGRYKIHGYSCVLSLRTVRHAGKALQVGTGQQLQEPTTGLGREEGCWGLARAG